MKIAWFTPFGRPSAIGQYSAIVLDRLSQDHEVTVYATGLDKGPSWRPQMRTRPVTGPVPAWELASFDITVYNLGNNHALHEAIHRTQLMHPGLAILHDLSTWDFFLGRLGARSLPQTVEWLHAMEYAHGPDARAWGKRFLLNGAATEATQEGAMRWTMARAAVHGALGVVVHGRGACEALAPQVSMPVEYLDFPSPNLPAPATATTDGKRVRLFSFGILARNKAPDLVIEAIAHSPLLRERCEYVMAGRIEADFARHLRDLVAKHGLGKCVRLQGPPDDATLHRLIDEAGVLVNLRYPHMGESSWSLLEGLWQGKAVVVWRHGYYDEFPDDVLAKVSSLPELTASLEKLVSRPDHRRQMEARARAHARERFSTEAYCQRLVSFLERCRSIRPVADLADRLSHHIRGLMGGAPPGLAERLAREIGLLAPEQKKLALRQAA